jgi:hypothetical protein
MTIIPQNQDKCNLPFPDFMFYNHKNTFRSQSQGVAMKRVLSFIIGTLLGGLVGGTVALLLAPSSGEELRSRISDRSEAFASDIRQAASTKRIELQERLEALRAPKA